MTATLCATRGKLKAMLGGLTGSKAGLSGSCTSGLGVEGVDSDCHFVPNPLVSDPGLAVAGVWGKKAGMLILLGAGVLAAWRIMCSGMAGRGD